MCVPQKRRTPLRSRWEVSSFNVCLYPSEKDIFAGSEENGFSRNSYSEGTGESRRKWSSGGPASSSGCGRVQDHGTSKKALAARSYCLSLLSPDVSAQETTVVRGHRPRLEGLRQVSRVTRTDMWFESCALCPGSAPVLSTAARRGSRCYPGSRHRLAVTAVQGLALMRPERTDRFDRSAPQPDPGNVPRDGQRSSAATDLLLRGHTVEHGRVWPFALLSFYYARGIPVAHSSRQSLRGE